MKRIIVLLLVIAIIVTVCSCGKEEGNNADMPQETIIVDIDISDLYYVRGWMNTGFRNAYYKDNKDALDKLVDMVEGEYQYIGEYSIEGKSGGGAYGITLYDSNGDVIYQILYRDNTLFFKTDKESEFYVYEKIGSELSFEWFEEYLRNMWKEEY